MKDCLLDFPSIMRPHLMFYRRVQYFKQQRGVVNRTRHIFHETPRPCEVGSPGGRRACPADRLLRVMNSYI